MDDNRTIKPADFGFARVSGTPIRGYIYEVVTLWWRSLEVLLGWLAITQLIFDQYFLQSFQALPTMKCGQKRNLHRLWKYIFQVETRKFSIPHQNLDANGLDLLSEMLVNDPAKWISGKMALNHPYFNDLDSQIKKI